MIIIENFVILWLFIVIFALLGLLIKNTWFEDDSEAPAIALSLIFSFIGTVLISITSSAMCHAITPDNIIEVIKYYKADLSIENNLLKIQIRRNDGTIEYGYIELKNK